MSNANRKRNVPESKWKIQIDDASTIRSIVEAVQNVVCRVTLKIVPSEGGDHYLRVDTADVAYTSCISVRLKLDSATLEEVDKEVRVCVDCKHVVPCLMNCGADRPIVIEGFDDRSTPKVRIRSDPELQSHENVYELDTYVDTDDVQLFAMEFDLLMEIDLLLLRGILKSAQNAKADHIAIHIYLKEDGGKTFSHTAFTICGEYTHRSSFCHLVVRDDDGSMVVRAAADSDITMFDTDDLNAFYTGLFPVDKVAGFVKPLQCRMITAHMKQDMPVMFSHRIGGGADDNEYIRYLIAPINPDTD